MFTIFTNGAIIYICSFSLPFTHLPQNPYKYQLLLPTIFTNRADIYILALMRLCFSAYFIVISKLITKFALFANRLNYGKIPKSAKSSSCRAT